MCLTDCAGTGAAELHQSLDAGAGRHVPDHNDSQQSDECPGY
jgi:hypothetical protein